MRTWLIGFLLAASACRCTDAPPQKGSFCLTDDDCVSVRSTGCSCAACNVKCTQTTLRGACAALRCTALVEEAPPGVPATGY